MKKEKKVKEPKKEKMDKKDFLKPKIIIPLIVGGAVIITTASVFIGMGIRKSRINDQASNYINYDNMCTTVYCSGENIHLNNKLVEKLKQEAIDLIISNEKYEIRIDSQSISPNINVGIALNKQSNTLSVNLLDNSTKALKINVKDISSDYISEFASGELVTNKLVVDENGFVDVMLKDNITQYELSYIVPEDIKLEDITMNKGTTSTIDIGLEERLYTYGTVNIQVSDPEAVEISDMDIKGVKLGEYTIVVSTPNISKEAKLKIEQGVEKIELSSVNLNLTEGQETTIAATVLPENAVNKEIEWSSSDDGVATITADGLVTAIKAGNCEITVSTKTEPKVEQKMQVEVKEKVNYVSQLTAPTGQVAGATYINGILLVNKTHPIPASYSPGLLPIAYNAFSELRKGAAEAGFDIQLISGYRSYETQKGLYNNYVATYGQAEADTFSAKPGTSEHQTGLAMDVGWIDDSYGDTPSGKWLAANCYKYGFIIRYPKGKEGITGYKYEPWHIRYLGVDIATDVYNSGLCLEEYLGAN